MKCISCGEYLTSNQFFCSACGKLNILCPNCEDLVLGDDSFCGKCGSDLSETIKKALELQKEKEKHDEENRKKELEEVRKQKLENEKKEYASNLIIECEGNKFKAIKKFKGKYNLDNNIACKYINDAYNIFGELKEEKTEPEVENADSIEEIVERNNFQVISSIKEVREKFGYDLKTAKQKVDYIINGSNVKEKCINPKGIKKTIIVSQSSRKKVTSVVGRGLIGGLLLGPVGLLASASAKSKEVTTFQIIHNNGAQETISVKNGSLLFKEYCRYLDN